MLSLLILVPLLYIVLLNLPLLKKITRPTAFYGVLLIALGQILFVFMRPYLTFQMLAGRLGSIDAHFQFNLVADGLSLLLVLTIGIVLFITAFVCRSLISGDAERFYFFNLLLLALTGMNGIVLLSDIFSMYVFIEIISIASFIMISYDRGRDALEGTFKYIVFSSVATTMMLSAIAILIIVAGGTSFAEIRAVLSTPSSNGFGKLASALFVTGLLVKAGIVPFHWWVPDVYSAAHNSASVLLAGVVTKVTGVYTLMRLVLSVFVLSGHIKSTLLLAGALSIVVGALLAMKQNNFKRMLAYSSISQMGYIIIGLGCGSALGIAGAAFHFFNHAMFKSSLFINAASVEKEAGLTDMDKMGGLSARMPYTSTTSVIAFFSAAGIPPFAGFWSKLLIVVALWQQSLYTYTTIAILASVLTMAYFLMLQRKVFFGTLREGLEKVKEADSGLVFSAVMLVTITVVAGLLFPLFYQQIIQPAGALLMP